MKTLNASLSEDFYETSNLLWVLGGLTRLKILKLVGEKDYTSKDVAKKLHCSRSNVVQQVQILVDAGLIEKIRLKDKTTRKILSPLYNVLNVKLRRDENE